MAWIFKKFIWFVVFVAILVIALLSYFAFIYDFNKFKPQLETRLSNLIKQNVKILGDIEFTNSGLNPAIIINDINVVNKQDTRNLFYVSELILTLSANSVNKFHQNAFNGVIELNDFGSQRVSFVNLKAPVNYLKNNIKFEKITGSILGGELTGDAYILNNEFKLDANIKDAEYSTFVRNLSGKTDINLNLQSSMANFVNDLSGKFLMIGSEIGKINLDGISPIITNLIKIDENNANVECTIANFDINNGIAKSQDIFLDSDEIRITGDGDIDFTMNNMNLNIHLKANRNKVLSTKLQITGNVDNAELSFDQEDLQRRIQKFALETIDLKLSNDTNIVKDSLSCDKILKKISNE